MTFWTAAAVYFVTAAEISFELAPQMKLVLFASQNKPQPDTWGAPGAIWSRATFFFYKNSGGIFFRKNSGKFSFVKLVGLRDSARKSFIPSTVDCSWLLNLPPIHRNKTPVETFTPIYARKKCQGRGVLLSYLPAENKMCNLTNDIAL